MEWLRWVAWAIVVGALGCGGAEESGGSGAIDAVDGGSGGAGQGGAVGIGGIGGTGGMGGVALDPCSYCAPGQSCVDGACVCAASAPVSFEADVQPILTNRCASSLCHDASLPKSQLALVEGQSLASLVSVGSFQCPDQRPRVVPGAPHQSYLMHKLLGVGLCTGKRMPPKGPLPEDEVKVLADWICQGASSD